ncbi:MAG: Minf_1886 family protein [Planctomycetota bacterium]
MTQQQSVDWDQMLSQAGPYPLEAFHFVRDGLSYTAQRVHRDIESLPEPDRHVTPQQLCLGLREYAIEKFGLLAETVLDGWNIRRTDDFGRIVFAMIDGGLMSKTQDDTMEDFRGVFDFAEAFAVESLATRICHRNN